VVARAGGGPPREGTEGGERVAGQGGQSGRVRLQGRPVGSCRVGAPGAAAAGRER